ncbi:WhiB family transcriptional regulator [Streptomyces sp. NRRL S-340]|uniref:WhiB family transcriptional regulator n=1 Tax=Streptomyces sp. NRRL S-340 TaxID=1463901 RepID=UPI00099CBD45|nr:WhiB family transcriptional regulator [Streptomyces sp. NRRL S-340]
MNRRERGACRFEAPERCFPPGEGVRPPRRIRQARAVCTRCPVPRECRACAARHSGYDGVRGGTAAGECRTAARGGGDGGR